MLNIRFNTQYFYISMLFNNLTACHSLYSAVLQFWRQFYGRPSASHNIKHKPTGAYLLFCNLEIIILLYFI